MLLPVGHKVDPLQEEVTFELRRQLTQGSEGAGSRAAGAGDCRGRVTEELEGLSVLENVVSPFLSLSPSSHLLP